MPRNRPTQIAVKAAAEAFRAAIEAEGESCGEINHSINRHDEASSYFRAMGATIRVSDHDANAFFRINEIQVFYTSATAKRARQLVAERRAAQAAADDKRAADIIARDAYEAPFIARFRAADKDHIRQQIFLEAYPKFADRRIGRQDRRPVWDRFVGDKK